MSTRFIIKYCVFQFLVIKIFSTNAQHSIKQYLHYTGIGPHSHSSGLSSLPSVGVSRPIKSIPSTGLSSLSSLSLPALISALQGNYASVNNLPLQGNYGSIPNLPLQGNYASSVPLPPSLTSLIPNSNFNFPESNIPNGGLDSNVINNLAIALQLLILSNIMNMPPTDPTESTYEEADLVSYPKLSQKPLSYTQQNLPHSQPQTQQNSPYSQPQSQQNLPYSQSQSQQNLPHSLSPNYVQQTPHPQSPEPQFSMPNSNFVGSSGFADSPNPMYSGPTKATTCRSSMTLMSPYEALAPSSPYSDPILSYRTTDFQSPYATVPGDTIDLFSMNDLF